MTAFSGSGSLYIKATLIATAYQTQFWGVSYLAALEETKTAFNGSGGFQAEATFAARLIDHLISSSVVAHPLGRPLIAHSPGQSLPPPSPPPNLGPVA
jgi:hypothetical protein